MAIQMNPSVILSAGNSVDSTEVSLDSSEIKLSDDITESEQGKAKKMCVYCHAIDPNFWPNPKAFYGTFSEKVFLPSQLVFDV